MVNAGNLRVCDVLKHVLEEKGRVSLSDREQNGRFKADFVNTECH